MIVTRVGLPALVSSWNGQVHSVFRSSCNIRLQDGPLICLHRFEYGVLPHSLYIPDLETDLFYPGQAVQATPEKIMVGNQHPVFWADDAEEVDTRIVTGPLPRIRDCEWAMQKRIRQGQEQGHDLLHQIYSALDDSLNRLIHALLLGRWDELTDHCRACIGFGQGLTPSGDDMLLGTFAALHRYAPEFAPALSNAVSPLLPCTNEISSSYLALAMDGYAATPVLETLHCLGSGQTQPMETLLSVGHSSGSDILFGILTTVKKLWDKEKGRM